jgi:hypothetical protein
MRAGGPRSQESNVRYRADDVSGTAYTSAGGIWKTPLCAFAAQPQSYQVCF